MTQKSRKKSSLGQSAKEKAKVNGGENLEENYLLSRKLSLILNTRFS